MITYHESSHTMRLLVRLLQRRYARTGRTLFQRPLSHTPLKPRGWTTTAIDDIQLHTLLRPHARAHVYYLPGGAYVQPASTLHVRFLRRLGAKLNVSITLLEYPLAPASTLQHTTSSTIHVLRQLMAETHVPVWLMGDSAGGGLALALATYLDDLCGLVLISPWLDLEVPLTQEQSPIDPVGFFTADELRRCGIDYAGDERGDRNASPIHLDHLPPIPIHVLSGSADLLAEDSRRLEKKFPQVELYEYSGAPHVFPLFPFLREQRQVLRLLSSWIAQ